MKKSHTIIAGAGMCALASVFPQTVAADVVRVSVTVIVPTSSARTTAVPSSRTSEDTQRGSSPGFNSSFSSAPAPTLTPAPASVPVSDSSSAPAPASSAEFAPPVAAPTLVPRVTTPAPSTPLADTSAARSSANALPADSVPSQSPPEYSVGSPPVVPSAGVAETGRDQVVGPLIPENFGNRQPAESAGASGSKPESVPTAENVLLKNPFNIIKTSTQSVSSASINTLGTARKPATSGKFLAGVRKNLTQMTASLQKTTNKVAKAITQTTKQAVHWFARLSNLLMSKLFN